MTSPEHVMQLLAEANPIPNVDVLERRAPFASTDFTDIRLPAPEAPEDPARPSRVRWTLVAAVIVAVIAAALVVGTRSSDVDPVDTIPAPTAVATPAPTVPPTPTAAPEEVSPSRQELEGAWEARSYGLVFEGGRYAVTAIGLAVDTGTYVHDGGELRLVSDATSASCPEGAEARFLVAFGEQGLELDPIDDDCGFDRGVGVGTKSLESAEAVGIPPSALNVARPLRQVAGPGLYVSERFSPGFSVVLPRGWRFHAAALAPDIDYTTSIVDNDTLIVWYRHPVDTPEDVYALFAADPSVEAGDPQPASVAGADGITFDYRSPQANGLLAAPGIGAGSIVGPPENVWRTWAADVDGVVVTVVASFPPDKLQEKSGEVQRILESIVWSTER